MINFIGTLSNSDRNELSLRGKSFNDNRNKKGLAALPSHGLNDLKGDEYIGNRQTDVFDPIYIIDPAKTTSSDFLNIVVQHHEGIANSVYYDPNNTEDSVKKTEVENAIEILRTSGVKIYTSIEEVAEHETEKE